MKNYRAHSPQNLALTKILHKFQENVHILGLHKCFCTVLLTVLKWVECIPSLLFIHDVMKCEKEIEGATDKKRAENLHVNKA